MKKKKIILLCVVMFLVVVASWYYVNLPDYYIRNSFVESNSSMGIRDVELQVIVPKFHLDDNELMSVIREEHNEINGEPTSLEIKLYRNLWHLRQGKSFATETFAKEH